MVEHGPELIPGTVTAEKDAAHGSELQVRCARQVGSGSPATPRREDAHLRCHVTCTFPGAAILLFMRRLCASRHLYKGAGAPRECTPWRAVRGGARGCAVPGGARGCVGVRGARRCVVPGGAWCPGVRGSAWCPGVRRARRCAGSQGPFPGCSVGIEAQLPFPAAPPFFSVLPRPSANLRDHGRRQAPVLRSVSWYLLPVPFTPGKPPRRGVPEAQVSEAPTWFPTLGLYGMKGQR